MTTRKRFAALATLAALVVTGVLIVVLNLDRSSGAASTRQGPVAAVGNSTERVDVPPEVMASHLSEAGIPPKPDAAGTDAYIAALTAIDPDIVHGKPEKAIDRGRNQCSSVKEQPNDRVKLVALTQMRFSSPRHPSRPDFADPGGFGPVKAEQILDVVRKYLCPTF